MSNLLRDLRYALRGLLSRPGFTAVALLSLALGLGANIAIFTLINAVFLQPLPVERPGELVSIYTTHPRFPGYIESSYLDLLDLTADRRLFAGLAAALPVPLTLRTAGGPPEQLSGELVSADYFRVLGVRPLLGRSFRAEEERPGTAPVAVLSHAFWRSHFGGDPGVIGRPLDLNGQKLTIVGVAPAGFRGTAVFASRDLWMPIGVRRLVVAKPVVDWFDGRVGMMMFATARLQPGVSLAQAQAGLETVVKRLAAAYPDSNQERGVAVLPLATLNPNTRGRVVRTGWFLSTVVALLLALTCVNLAALLLARAVGRRREIAARLAIGAGRGRLLRQLLTESLLLAALGGVAGLLVAAWGRGVLWRLRPPTLPDSLDLSFDPRVWAFAAGVTVVAGLVFGLMPALQTSRPDLVPALKNQAPTLPGRRFSVLDLLVVVQVGLSLVLLLATGLLARSFARVASIPPGFAARELVALSVRPETAGYDEPRGLDFLRRAAETAAALPGVRGAAVASNRPLYLGLGGSVYVLGRETVGPDGKGATAVRTNAVGPGYFPTVGVPLLAGRAFTAADRTEAPLVVVINQTLARHLWPNGSPLGQKLGFVGATDTVEVVGVVADVKYESLSEEPQPYLYFALAQSYGGQATIYVRTEHPAQQLESVRRAVQALDPNLPLLAVTTVGEVLDQSLWAPRAGAGLLAVFASLGLILAVLGTYGLMAHAVEARRREIGIRVAVGAGRRDVLVSVLRFGLVRLVGGLALGTVAALWASRLVAGFLYGIEATDPVTFLVAPLVLLAAALAAMAVPARRALRVDPLQVLRTE